MEAHGERMGGQEAGNQGHAAAPRPGFPPAARLRRAGEFLAVRRRGLRLSAFPLKARALASAGSQSRLGMAIGRRTGSAVVRNGWKRAIRQAFRLQRHALPGSWDLVVTVAPSAHPQDAAQVGHAMQELLAALAGMAGRTEEGQ